MSNKWAHAVSVARATFDEMDTNKNGVLDPDELTTCMRQVAEEVGVTFDESQVHEVMKELDTNGN